MMPKLWRSALAGKSLPIYGDGQQIRDWLYGTDHFSAIRTVLAKGKPGEVYNVGGWNEMPNIQIVHTLCDLLDELAPLGSRELGVGSGKTSYRELIAYVPDRPVGGRVRGPQGKQSVMPHPVGVSRASARFQIGFPTTRRGLPRRGRFRGVRSWY